MAAEPTAVGIIAAAGETDEGTKGAIKKGADRSTLRRRSLRWARRQRVRLLHEQHLNKAPVESELVYPAVQLLLELSDATPPLLLHALGVVESTV
jgi:hypothetical protein